MLVLQQQSHIHILFAYSTVNFFRHKPLKPAWVERTMVRERTVLPNSTILRLERDYTGLRLCEAVRV